MKISGKNLRLWDRTPSGFTIMELLVVSILMVVVMMVTAQFWRWFSPGVSDLIAKEHLLREARLTMQSLAYDFGAVSEISGGGSFLLTAIYNIIVKSVTTLIFIAVMFQKERISQLPIAYRIFQ